nr:hypothetical protein CFP56_33501 [Quercus suber]
MFSKRPSSERSARDAVHASGQIPHSGRFRSTVHYGTKLADVGSKCVSLHEQHLISGIYVTTQSVGKKVDVGQRSSARTMPEPLPPRWVDLRSLLILNNKRR